MIYSFNAKDNVMYSVIKSSFGLSDEAVYKTIQDEFSVLLKRLSCKRVSYEKLKGALVPNQEANMYETCLVVDWMQIDDCNYGARRKILCKRYSTKSRISHDQCA